MATFPAVSEYEAKRLRRIAANHDKLQALQMPSLAPICPPVITRKTQKRQVQEQRFQEPRRKSLRQRKERYVETEQLNQRLIDDRKKCTRVGENATLKQLEQGNRLVRQPFETVDPSIIDRNHNKIEEVADVRQGNMDDLQDLEQEQGIGSVDWRARRKVQAREEKRRATVKLREERSVQRVREKKKRHKRQLQERKICQRQKESVQLARLVAKELELQRRTEEGELMRMEDRAARQLVKQEAKERKLKQVAMKKVELNEQMRAVLAGRLKREREREEDRDKEMYPVRKLPLPFVHIADRSEGRSTKPVVVTPLLKVDANLFHAFSLGKQFLPPGRHSVMQGVCPGGYTASFRHDVDVHVWKNAMTLFVHGTTGMFYRSMFEENEVHGRTYVSFRWTRCQDVTPLVLYRISQLQKGEESLRVDKSYDDPLSRHSSEKPEPLLLFIQYPKGPYIYCGRLGYLGHRTDPLEISFQLLDVDALNWKQITTLILSG
uniref:Uncharacterized protein n=1 Tax=Peronospora matthiolae TaxID=2874970 RepID=A0AAV1UEV7_9STRA